MTVTLGILACDVAEPAQLRRVQMAIRHVDAQHRREALHVQAVAKAQRAEFIFGQLARVITRDLLAKLRGALRDQGLVAFIKIGRASCREKCGSTCRSRWSPYH